MSTTHEAGWAHAPGGLRGPAWLSPPTDPDALVPHLWSLTAHKVDGELHVGGLAVPELVANVNTPAYVLDEADFRSRARAFREAFAAYDVYYAGKAFLCTAVAGWVQEEGLCLGGSTGINIAGAIRLARDLGPGHTIVTILCDYGTRYQSKLFNPQFLRGKDLPIPTWMEGSPQIEIPFEPVP